MKTFRIGVVVVIAMTLVGISAARGGDAPAASPPPVVPAATASPAPAAPAAATPAAPATPVAPTTFTRAKTDPPSLILTPGREFAADSYVHKPLPADAPLDPHSAEYVADLLRQIKQFYGTVNVNYHNYAPPIYQVGPDQPTVRVRAHDRKKPEWKFPPLQALWEAVPLPDDFQASPGTDQEAVVYQPSTGRYWEFWQMQKTGEKTRDSAGREVDEWGARWGGRIDNLATSPGYVPTTKEGYKFGTTATSLPLLAGLLTIDEQLRGEVNHALHMALVETLAWQYWSHPAQRSDGHISPEKNPYAIPEGATFRLPADLDLDKIAMDPYARMIAKAVQKYGLVVRDKAGATVLYAENPAGRYAVDPYTWIFRGRKPEEKSFPAYARLKSFPWDKLQMLKPQMNKPIPAPAAKPAEPEAKPAAEPAAKPAAEPAAAPANAAPKAP